MIMAALLVFGGTYYFSTHKSDKCTAADRALNNCVPAGSCTPPGDPREDTVDCMTYDYDRKYKGN